MADQLTPEAKAEIAEAVRIVRQDKMDKFLRSHPLLNPKRDDPPPDPKKTAPPKPTDPPTEPPTDPPPPKPADPPTDPPKAGKGLWWNNDTAP